MASSSSSSPSPFQMPKLGDTTITQDELFAFHNIDRHLFARLVFGMSHEPTKAMHVIAFWMWLERLNKAQYIAKIVNFNENVFKAIVEETFLCLKVVDSEILFPSNDIPIIISVVGSHFKGISLKFFHENRASILVGIDHFIENTCLRAFKDLIQIALENKPTTVVNQPNPSLPKPFELNVRVRPNFGVIGDRRSGGVRPTPPPSLPPSYGENSSGVVGNLVNNPNLIKVGEVSVPLQADQSNEVYNNPNSFFSRPIARRPINHGPVSPANSVINNLNYGLEAEPKGLEEELVDQLIAHLQLIENPVVQNAEEKPIVLPSERTIFLTFSKGYPVLETELREYINRSFGDIIETLHMQEVGEKEQPLYARLVVRDAKAMDIVLSEQGKSKFSINGKHVCARKYEPKNPNSPAKQARYL